VSDAFSIFFFDAKINEERSSEAFEQNGVMINETKNEGMPDVVPKSPTTSTIGLQVRSENKEINDIVGE